MTTTAERPSSRPTTRRRTELDAYPKTGQRYFCLGIVVVATIVLYYQFYLAGSVAAGTGGKNGILTDYHMSFTYYVNIAVVGYILGAVASFVTGVADKVGRVNIITAGLFIVSLLCMFGIPLAHSKAGFAVVFALIGLVEGVILVATPALIRDFSPQLGRASAMGFWTLGPVLGSLVVAIQVSGLSGTYPWHNQYVIAGIVGLVIAVASLLFLRELSPGLRDQVMVSARDRAVIEARAAGIDVEASLKHPFRQMLRADIVLSAFAISVFLIIYYVAVGFFPVYFQTIFHFSQPKANRLGDWIWAFDAAALLIIGFVSDKVRVRKPFMVVGALGAIVMTIIFASRATHPNTSFSTFALQLSLLAIFLGVAYAPWMASFTETVEKRNPALAATGLAVWGLVIRIVIAVSVFIVPHVINTVSPLVEKGPVAQQLAAQYAPELATAAKVDPATQAALAANPNDPAAGVKAISEISGVSVADVTTVATLNATEPTVIAALQKIDPATQAALAANPLDQAAGIKAISDITGISLSNVTTVATLYAEHGPALAAAQTIDPTTIATLLANPKDTAALQTAIGEIVAKLGVTPAQALARLTDLKGIPVTQLLVLEGSGTAVVAAQATLAKAATIPVAQLAVLQASGAKVAAAQAQLVALGKVPAADIALLKQVQKAANASPKQWQHYFWIAVGGEIVFIPLIFLLTGFWDPRKARKQEEEHEAWLNAELARLAAGESVS